MSEKQGQLPFSLQLPYLSLHQDQILIINLYDLDRTGLMYANFQDCDNDFNSSFIRLLTI